MGQNDVLDWLLAHNDPWVRYRTHIDLLGKTKEESDVRQIYGELTDHPRIRSLLEAVAEWPQPVQMKKAYDPSDTLWKIQTLADFGLERSVPEIASLSEKMLDAQAENGGFLQGGFAHTKSWNNRPYACVTHILTYALVCFGYLDDERLAKAVDYLQAWQRLDGGWHPNEKLLPGQSQQDDPSCPFGTVNTLRALSVLPELREGEAAHRAVMHVLGLWERRDEPYRPVGFGIGSTFRKLQYPFVQYQLLKTVDTLSNFSFAKADKRMHEMVKIIVEKQNEDGFWLAEGINKPWAEFDFGQKKQPSGWITFLALRSIRRTLPDLDLG